MATDDINLKIEGMDCSGCASGIKTALETRGIVENAEVDLDTKSGKFKLKGKSSKKDLEDAIKEMGYKVKEQG